VPATTRGPLPPGVYWRRRLAVLSLALVVFLGVGKILSHGSDGSSDGTAEQAGAVASTSPTATVAVTPPASAKSGQGKHGQGKHGQGNGKGHGHGKGSATPTPTPTPPPTPVRPDPTGPCDDNDVYITPSIAAPIGGSDITVMLNLQTRSSVACTWQLSPDTMRMNIVSGADQIWLSRQCPKAIPTQDVVVRLASVTQVPVVWNARRSDSECSDRTAWALPGFYHVRAAVLGGEPTDVQFELVPPAAPTVTQTARPGGKGSGNKPKS
jgi:hypothetical protein